MRILVTGGAGYIGSHTCKALAQAGYEPIVVDNLSRGFEWAVKWGPFEQADISDGARLAEIIEQYKPVAAVHFAAFAYVGESAEDPLLYYKNNVGGSLSLINALQDAGNLPLVFSSTCAVYGIPEVVPIEETAPFDPVNVYGRTKLMVEEILRDCDAYCGMRSVALRYFNAAGADADGEIGEAHDPESHLIPLALAAASRDGSTLSIFGDDYPTPDGTPIRDYIHVDDLARAHVAALKYLIEGGTSTALNLGTGSGYSVLDILQSVERVTGKPVPAVNAPRRIGDPPSLVANAQKATKLLGLSMESSKDIDAIIGSAWNWMKKNG